MHVSVQEKEYFFTKNVSAPFHSNEQAMMLLLLISQCFFERCMYVWVGHVFSLAYNPAEKGGGEMI